MTADTHVPFAQLEIGTVYVTETLLADPGTGHPETITVWGRFVGAGGRGAFINELVTGLEWTIHRSAKFIPANRCAHCDGTGRNGSVVTCDPCAGRGWTR